MARILYIYGFLGSANGGTVTLLRNSFPEHEFISVSYPQEDFNKSIVFLEEVIEKERIEMVMASSLGAFIALNLKNAPKTLVINPCMKPSFELAHIGTGANLPQSMLDTYKDADEHIWEHEWSPDIKGCFSYRDSVLYGNYKEDFRRHYGDFEMMDCDHRLEESAIAVIRKMLAGML